MFERITESISDCERFTRALANEAWSTMGFPSVSSLAGARRSNRENRHETMKQRVYSDRHKQSLGGTDVRNRLSVTSPRTSGSAHATFQTPKIIDTGIFELEAV